ncbi:hypothetical protein KKG08_03140 [Patescibacteria group bacterium]|nr:hypothetical protein [Patescibacteria group bacterium]
MASLKAPKRITEKQLRDRFNTVILGITTMVFVGGISIFFFAPQIGAFFGFFSKHRGEESYRPTAKPSAPVFEDVPEAVNENSVDLSGRAQPGETILLFVNGPEKAKTTADSEGKFNFVDVHLINGKNTLFAKALDSQNRESDKTAYFYITVDNDSPEIEIDEPKNGDTVKNLNRRIRISGKINEKATITINGGTVVQKPDFSFDYDLGVKEGSVKIEIKAVDPAGNEATQELNVTYQEKSS